MCHIFYCIQYLSRWAASSPGTTISCKSYIMQTNVIIEYIATGPLWFPLVWTTIPCFFYVTLNCCGRFSLCPLLLVSLKSLNDKLSTLSCIHCQRKRNSSLSRQANVYVVVSDRVWRFAVEGPLEMLPYNVNVLPHLPRCLNWEIIHLSKC